MIICRVFAKLLDDSVEKSYCGHFKMISIRGESFTTHRLSTAILVGISLSSTESSHNPLFDRQNGLLCALHGIFHGIQCFLMFPNTFTSALISWNDRLTPALGAPSTHRRTRERKCYYFPRCDSNEYMTWWL